MTRPPPLADPFAQADHTIVLSDVHLCEAEPHDPKRPLWKRFKQRDLFIDDCFARFLGYVRTVADGSVELIFNGDLFDFDSVTVLPEDPPYRISWAERRRGLAPEQRKSLFKIGRILRDHAEWFRAVTEFLAAGHRVVFVIGNHDLELHWPSVQAEVVAALDPDGTFRDQIRFCEFYYVSNGDTLVQHGNQFDAYCLCTDPVHPFVQLRSEPRVRLPFGNLAQRYMLNGMGLFNPYVDESFIRPAWDYVKFFYQYVMKVQPLLVLTWLWGAVATLVLSLREGFLPAIKEPLKLEERMDDIARRANSQPGVARALLALSVHPAIYSPWKIARELWLDRALLLALCAAGSFQAFSFLNVFVHISVWWAALVFAILLPPFLFYARSVNSDINNTERAIHRLLPVVARAAGVRRVVLGHTHRERHTGIEGIELLNTGTWSPAYHDVECTEPFGRNCFAWIKPDPAGDGRLAELREWKDPGSEVFVPEAPPRPLLPAFDMHRRALESRSDRLTGPQAALTSSKERVAAVRPPPE